MENNFHISLYDLICLICLGLELPYKAYQGHSSLKTIRDNL